MTTYRLQAGNSHNRRRNTPRHYRKAPELPYNCCQCLVWVSVSRPVILNDIGHGECLQSQLPAAPEHDLAIYHPQTAYLRLISGGIADSGEKTFNSISLSDSFQLLTFVIFSFGLGSNILAPSV